MSGIGGTILHLQRLSTEDGPGIRTTVFLKGCPLRCAWCHNPESIARYPQVHWIQNRCIGCNTCLEACPRGGLRRGETGLIIDRAVCQGCGSCAEACPAGALEVLGRAVQADDLVEELLKDRAYYEKSGGGVTLSGGEPTLQPEFSAEVFRLLRGAGISTALDTCGLCGQATLADLLPRCDLVLYDLKLLDSRQHRQFTGADNQRILENLTWLCGQLAREGGARLWIRTPLIPRATFLEENIRGISAWLADHTLGQVERWELCAFNNLCRDKYARLDMDWEFAADGLMRADELAQAGEWAAQGGFDRARTFVTGAARME